MLKKILLVEDDPFLSEIYITKFEEAGYVIEVADDGEKGFQKAIETKPDIILLDVILPKMTGWDILKALKKDNKMKNMAIIVLSNLGTSEDIDRAKELGAAGYLIKSQYTPSEVLAKVEKVLNSKK